MKHHPSRRTSGPALAALGIVSLLATSACGPASPSGETPQSDTAKEFTYLGTAENSVIRGELTKLSTGACSAQNKALPLKVDTVATTDVIQKITLLASQDALPVHFVSGTAMTQRDGDLGKNNLLVDYEAKLKELGKWDDVNPAAAETVKAIYGGMYSLPYQYNVEGIFYNKLIVAAQGISEPKTYDELMAAMAKLKDAGYIPMTQSAGFPLTRLIGIYIFRKLGPDAMAKIKDGSAKLTDPGYVEAAESVADMAAKGYFGEGVTSRDADASTAQFLTGKAAMTYTGSWVLPAINDSEQNKIGADAIGLMPYPTVPGGTGTADQWPANAGAPNAMSARLYGPKVGDWLGCIAENFATQAMKDTGSISGFKLKGDAGDVPPMTKQVQKIVDSTDETVLWFEALMDSKTNALASSNVPLLVTGKMSPHDYMASLQSSIESAR